MSSSAETSGPLDSIAAAEAALDQLDREELIVVFERVIAKRAPEDERIIRTALGPLPEGETPARADEAELPEVQDWAALPHDTQLKILREQSTRGLVALASAISAREESNPKWHGSGGRSRSMTRMP